MKWPTLAVVAGHIANPSIPSVGPSGAWQAPMRHDDPINHRSQHQQQQEIFMYKNKLHYYSIVSLYVLFVNIYYDMHGIMSSANYNNHNNNNNFIFRLVSAGPKLIYMFLLLSFSHSLFLYFWSLYFHRSLLLFGKFMRTLIECEMLRFWVLRIWLPEQKGYFFIHRCCCRGGNGVGKSWFNAARWDMYEYWIYARVEYVVWVELLSDPCRDSSSGCSFLVVLSSFIRTLLTTLWTFNIHQLYGYQFFVTICATSLHVPDDTTYKRYVVSDIFSNSKKCCIETKEKRKKVAVLK